MGPTSHRGSELRVFGYKYKQGEIFHHQSTSLACRMESLESKLDRLSPDQRKEVEDFIDFLMYRSGNSQEPPATAPVPPQIQKVAPPLIVQEPVHTPENPQVKELDISHGENPSILVPLKEQPTPFQEIAAGNNDRITWEYMDYGQFERQQSPAIVAVKKVKEKLKQQEKHEKSRELLDWID